ncbi:MAG: glycosyltransferase [Acidobacteriota bacterium]|nr:glycosyltransferase [Acidobacteriota bacterium]
MSRVLVVTPTYGTEANGRLRLLLQTIASVRQQTHRDYIHVVVDDGSTDCTLDVLERLARSDERLRVATKRNGGSSSAINYGVESFLAQETPDYRLTLRACGWSWAHSPRRPSPAVRGLK